MHRAASPSVLWEYNLGAFAITYWEQKWIILPATQPHRCLHGSDPFEPSCDVTVAPKASTFLENLPSVTRVSAQAELAQ